MDLFTRLVNARRTDTAKRLACLFQASGGMVSRDKIVTFDWSLSKIFSSTKNKTQLPTQWKPLYFVVCSCSVNLSAGIVSLRINRLSHATRFFDFFRFAFIGRAPPNHPQHPTQVLISRWISWQLEKLEWWNLVKKLSLCPLHLVYNLKNLLNSEDCISQIGDHAAFTFHGKLLKDS